MPSSLSLLLYNSSHSLLKDVSKTNDDNDILEYPSDYDISSIYSDDIDNDNQQSIYLNRQVGAFNNNRIKNSWRHENQFIKSDSQDEKLFLNSNRHQIFSPSQIKSANMVDNKQQPRNTRVFSFNNHNANIQKVHSIPQSNRTQSQSTLSSTRTRANVMSSPIRTSIFPTDTEPRKSISRIPVRSKSLSLGLAATKRKIPSPSSSGVKTALQVFSADNHPPGISSVIHSKARSSSVHITSSLQHDRKRLTSSDDDDVDTNDLKENDLKQKLKEEKRQSKKTTDILNKLHENYEELLEKFAQAENTIDHLRFQPNNKIAALRSSGTNGSPQRPMSSSVTSAIKSMSSGNSCTLESVFYDETTPQKNIEQELTIPETVKLDLLIRTKTLGDNMKSFLMLMNTNQVSIAEQKQVYESIKLDYENLMKTLAQKKQDGDLDDMDLDGDLSKELEMMKQLLKEIAVRITGNLFGKSTNNSSIGRQTLLTHDDSRSSQSAQSSLCNHNDLMDQYKKLLNAVNTGNIDKRDRIKSVINGLATDLKEIKITRSAQPSPIDLFGDQSSTENKLKPYLYTSRGSEDDQQQSNDISPIPFMKGVESISLELNCIPSTSVEHHQPRIEEKTHKNDNTKTIEKKNVANKQKNNNLENIAKKQEYNNLEHITNTEQQEIIIDREYTKQSSPLTLTDRTRNSNSSSRTRANDYDSGVGTNTNTNTKITSESKHGASPMDESHLQSLDEGQESISSTSRSTGSDSGSLYSKYIRRFNSSSICRRKLSRQSDSCLSDIESHIIDSSDTIPQPSATTNKKMHRSCHSWRPQRTSSPQRSRLSLFHQGRSIESTEIESNETKSCHPFNTPRIRSKKTTDQSLEPQQIIPTTHRSSIHINQAHTYKQTQQKSNQTSSNKLYLDPHKGVIYRLDSKEIQNPTRIHYQPPSQTKMHRCSECGSVVAYHHRRLINSKLRRAASQIDDPGYESGYKKRSRSCRYAEYLSSSDSDSDLHPKYLEMIALNEAYDQAEKVQDCSQRLSQYITRQLKLALSII